MQTGLAIVMQPQALQVGRQGAEAFAGAEVVFTPPDCAAGDAIACSVQSLESGFVNAADAPPLLWNVAANRPSRGL